MSSSASARPGARREAAARTRESDATRRLDHDIPALLAGLRPEHQQLAHQWIRWVVLPRLRTMVERGREVTASVTNARRQIEQVTAFLTALHHTGRHLDACTQHDIDAWFAQPAAIRRVIRPFLAWTRRHRHLPASRNRRSN